MSADNTQIFMKYSQLNDVRNWRPILKIVAKTVTAAIADNYADDLEQSRTCRGLPVYVVNLNLS